MVIFHSYVKLPEGKLLVIRGMILQIFLFPHFWICLVDFSLKINQPFTQRKNPGDLGLMDGPWIYGGAPGAPKFMILMAYN